MSRKSGSKNKGRGRGRGRGTKVNGRAENPVSPPAGEEESDVKTCNAILLTRSEGGSDEDIKENAESALRRALGEPLHIETIRDEHFVGNDRGLDLAGRSARAQALEGEVALHKEKHASHEAKHALHEAKHASIEAKIAGLERSHKAEIAELKEILHTLSVSCKEHRQVRNRFISTYKRDKFSKRDKLGMPAGPDRQIIRDRNRAAHKADAIVDCTFYTSSEERSDIDVFEELYGLYPEEVHALGMEHGPTIAVLNTHATIISSPFKEGSDKFYDSFAEFIKLLRSSRFDASYLEDRRPDKKLDNLVSAYRLFLRCAVEQVREVSMDD